MFYIAVKWSCMDTQIPDVYLGRHSQVTINSIKFVLWSIKWIVRRNKRLSTNNMHNKCCSQSWHDVNWIFIALGRYWFFSSVPVSVLKPRFLRFHGTGSGTSVLVLTSQYQGFGTRFSGGYLHLSNFGTDSVPFRLQIRWNLKLWYWNLNWLEPKLLKIFGTKIHKLRFFGIFGFRPTLFLLDHLAVNVSNTSFRNF